MSKKRFGLLYLPDFVGRGWKVALHLTTHDIQKNMNYQKLVKILFLVFLFFPVCFSIVSAQEIELPALPGIEAPAREIPDLLRYFYQILLVLGVILSLGLLIYAGFLYLVSFGNPKLMSEARQRVISCFLGLLLLFSSYVILSTIDPKLVIWEIEILPVRPLERPELVDPGLVAPRKIGLTHIPIERTFKAIHDLEKQSLAIAKKMNDLITGPHNIANTAKGLRTAAQGCNCGSFRSDCRVGCPTCCAICPPKQDNRGCLPQIRSSATKLAEQLLPDLEKEILLLEEKIKLLTKVQIEFDNYRRQISHCRTRMTAHLWICAEARHLGFLAECSELDFYCHYF